MQLSIDTIISAHKRIKPYIINTPIKSNEEINQLVEADIYFKCENMQNYHRVNDINKKYLFPPYID